MPSPPFKRMRRTEIPGVRFLTFSCHRRLQLLGTARLRDLFVEHLAEAKGRCGFRLFGWVVMPEHVHLLLEPDLALATTDVICARIKQGVGQTALARWRNLRAPILSRLEVGGKGDGDGPRYRFWQAGGGYDRNVRSDEKAEGNLVYIYQNHVERGLVARPTDGPWSSARWYAAAGRGGPWAVAIDSPEIKVLRERYRLALVEGRAGDGDWGRGWDRLVGPEGGA